MEGLQRSLNYSDIINDICWIVEQMNGHLPLSFLMVLIILTLVLLQWVHPCLPPLVQPSSPLITPDGEQVHQYTDSIPTSIMKIPGLICRVCLQKWAVSVDKDWLHVKFGIKQVVYGRNHMNCGVVMVLS